MRGLSGLTETLSQLFEQAGIALPPWAFPAAAGLAFIALVPWIRQNHRTHQARKLIHEAGSESASDRAALRAAALALVERHPVGLVSIADEALRRGMLDLARQALERLKAHGKPTHEIIRLQTAIDGPPPAHLYSEIQVIEQLLSNGMTQAAENRIARAQKFWPDAPELLRLATVRTEE